MDEERVYFISDLHLFHANIIEYEHRPFNSLYHMHETIVQNWNKVIKSTDKVFILGDLTFGSKEKTKPIIEKLNGQKYLVKGNHDKHPNQWYRDIGIKEVYEHPILFNNYYILTHEPMLYLKEPFSNLHGHVHSSPNFPTITKASACVCIERWSYTPVSLFTLTKGIMKKRAWNA